MAEGCAGRAAATSFAELPSRLEPGQAIFVTRQARLLVSPVLAPGRAGYQIAARF